MTNDLSRVLQMRTENLSDRDYFQSLLTEAQRTKLLSDDALQQIQLQSIELLAAETQRYTSGDSSSVPVKIAQGLLESILFALGVCLKHAPTAEDAVSLLLHTPLSELFAQGKKRIRQQINRAKVLFSAVQRTKLETKNTAYDDTLWGIAPFFTSYDVDFAAQEIPATIDYPLSQDSDLQGISYLSHYLQSLLLENQFCYCFQPEKVEALLYGYDAGYADLLINVFDQVLLNALGCAVLGVGIDDLHITADMRERLQEKLAPLSDEARQLLLQQSAQAIFEILSLSSATLQDYVLRSIKKLDVRLVSALKMQTLASLFVTPAVNQQEILVEFEDGNSMSNEEFRSFLEAFDRLPLLADKIAYMQKEVHSYLDLISLLEANSLYGDDFFAVFEALSDPELALISKNLPSEMDDLVLHFTKSEAEWQGKLLVFLERMERTRRERIEVLAKHLRG